MGEKPLVDPELQRLIALAKQHNASPEDTKAFLASHGYSPPSAAPAAPAPKEEPGLLSRIASSVAEIPKDAYDALFTPVQGSTKPINPGRAGWPGGVRPADAGAVITPENSPGSITPDRMKNAAIHTLANVSMGAMAPEAEAIGASKLTLAQRALQGAKVGGKMGFVAGAANADPSADTSLPESLAERFGGGVKGAIGGAAIAGIGAPIAGAVFNPVIDAAKWGGKKVLAMTPGLSIAEPSEAELISQRIFGTAKPRAVKRAMRVIGDAQETSGLAPAAEAARLNAPLASPGADGAAVAADLGGDPMVQLSGAVARTPGSRAGQEMKSFALQRSAGRGARMQSGLEAATGEESALPQLPDQIKAETSDPIQNLYATAENTAKRIPLTPQQQQVLSHPNLRKAFNEALSENSANLSAGQDKPLESFFLHDRLAQNLPISDADREAMTKVLTRTAVDPKAATGIVTSDIDPTTLNAVIQRLDDQIETAKGRGDPFRGLQAQRDQLSTALDTSPEFRAAKDAAQESFQRQDAAKAGRTAGNLTGPNEKQIQGMIDGSIPLPGHDKATGFPMSPAAEAEFRRGFAGQLGQNLLDTKSNALLNNDKSVVMDRRLRAGLGDDVTDRFMPVAKGETDLRKLEQQVTSGSQTAERGAQDQALNSDPMMEAASAAASGFGGMNPAGRGLKGMMALVRSGIKDRASQMNAGTADAASDFLLSGSKGKASLADAQRLLSIQRAALARKTLLQQRAGAVTTNLANQNP